MPTMNKMGTGLCIDASKKKTYVGLLRQAVHVADYEVARSYTAGVLG